MRVAPSWPGSSARPSPPRAATPAWQCGPSGKGKSAAACRCGCERRQGLAEGMPGPTRSYISPLAAQHPFVCPLFGGDLTVDGRQALHAQPAHSVSATSRSRPTSSQPLQDMPPSAPLLHSLGLSLAQARGAGARLPNACAWPWLTKRRSRENRLTASYLAMCAVPRQAAPAGGQAAQHRSGPPPAGPLPPAGDVEWAGLNSRRLRRGPLRRLEPGRRGPGPRAQGACRRRCRRC